MRSQIKRKDRRGYLITAARSNARQAVICGVVPHLVFFGCSFVFDLQTFEFQQHFAHGEMVNPLTHFSPENFRQDEILKRNILPQ
jgi:hypothetical protein